MTTQARVEVPVIVPGWTHIGGPSIHVLVGLPETDERLVRASAAADLDDLDLVIAVLAERGVRATPPFVGVAPVGERVRVVAHGPTWVQVEGAGAVGTYVPPSDRVWLDTDLAGPVDVVRLRIGAPPEEATASMAAGAGGLRAAGVSPAVPAPAAPPRRLGGQAELVAHVRVTGCGRRATGGRRQAERIEAPAAMVDAQITHAPRSGQPPAHRRGGPCRVPGRRRMLEAEPPPTH